MKIEYDDFIKHPEVVLKLYEQGWFPMAEDGDVDWYSPEIRGVIKLEKFHVPRTLRKFMRQKQDFEIRIDQAFEDVIDGCAAPYEGRDSTWINEDIKRIFCFLHEQGHAHSVECWRNERLVGGLYGVHVGAVFCGESMFSCTPNASKVALVYLVEMMKACGFILLDTQFTNDHLQQFGIQEMPRQEYLEIMQKGLNQSVQWAPNLLRNP